MLITWLVLIGFWIGLALAEVLVWIISHYIWGEFNVNLFVALACLFGGICASLQYSNDSAS